MYLPVVFAYLQSSRCLLPVVINYLCDDFPKSHQYFLNCLYPLWSSREISLNNLFNMYPSLMEALADSFMIQGWRQRFLIKQPPCYCVTMPFESFKYWVTVWFKGKLIFSWLICMITLTISTMLKSYKSLFNGVRVRVRVSFFKHSKKVMFLVDLFEINLLFSC